MPIQVPVVFRGDADDLVDDIDRSLRGSVNRSFASFGRAAADRFSRVFERDIEGFSTRFRSGLTGSLTAALQGAVIRDPRVLALFAASVASFFPAIGTLAAGAFVLGFGGGLAGLGIAFAAQNSRIKKIFKDLGSDIADTMRDISKPFEATLEVIARVARRTFEAFVPDLRKAFVKMAPVISQFTRILGRAFEQLAPTIQPVTRAFIRILQDAGPRLVPFFKSLADAVIGLARSISKNPDVFNDLLGNLFNLIPALINFVAFLTRTQAKIEAFFAALSNSSVGTGFKNLIKGITTTVQDFFKILNKGGEVGKTFGAIKDFIAPLLPVLQNTAKAVGGALSDGFKEIAGVLNSDFLPAIQRLLPILQPIVKFLLEVLGRAVVGALKGAFQAIKGALQLISGLINVFVGIVTLDWDTLWKGLKQIAKGAFNIIAGLVRLFLNVTIISAFRKFAAFLLGGLWKNLWKGMGSAARGGFRAIVAVVSGGLRALLRAVIGFVRGFIQFWKTLFTGLISAARNAWKTLFSAFGGPLRAILTLVTGTGRAIASAFVGALRGMIGGVQSAWNAIRTAVANGIRAIMNLVRNLPGQLGTIIRSGIGILAAAGAALITGLANSIADKMADVIGAVKDGLGKIASLLPGSPIREGPLVGWNGGKPGRALMELIAKGIRLGTPAAIKSAIGAFAKIADLIAKQLKNKDISKKAAEAMTSQIRQLSAALEKEAARTAAKLAERLNFVSGLRDRLKSDLDLTGILEGSGGDVSKFISGVGAFAAGIKQFAERLTILRKRGLHPALLSEIAGLGSIEGNKVAQLLLNATKAQTSQLNQAFANIGQFSNQAADTVGTGLFGTNAQIQAEGRGNIRDIFDGGPRADGRGRERVVINQNFFGPTTSGGRMRELDWTLRYATRARRERHGGVAK